MHTGTLKKLALVLTFWLAIHRMPLSAQVLPLGPYGTSPTAFGVDSNGLLSATGTFGTGSLTLSGAGTRMFWYPGKAAFRSGFIDSTNSTVWDDSNIGNYSAAFGIDTTASGNGSAAFGTKSEATGSYSAAFGNGSIASGTASTASGYGSTASGYASTAFGGTTVASGEGSTASGYYSVASGEFSSASGYQTIASGLGTVALGSWNVGTGDHTNWVLTDPLFEIGNGTPPSAANGYAQPTRSDAVVVYKNGNMTVQGVVSAHAGLLCPQQGDISMGSFTAGTAP